MINSNDVNQAPYLGFFLFLQENYSCFKSVNKGYDT